MNLVNLAAASEIRKEILLLIIKKPGSLEEIESLPGVSPASLKFHIKKLVNSGLLEEEGGKYKLSYMAVPIIENLKELLDSLAFFEENMDYWKNHDLTPIPDFLLERLEELGRFELIESDAAHVFELPQAVMDNLRASEEIFAILSCLHPEIPSFYSEFAKKGLKLSLCVTELIAERMFRDCLAETRTLLEAENTKLCICSRTVNIPIFLVTDRFMVLRLSLNNGKHSSQLIICSGDGALYWGRDLYKYYENSSGPLRS